MSAGRSTTRRSRASLQAKGARIESATTGTVLTNVQTSGPLRRIAAGLRPLRRRCRQGRARHRHRRVRFRRRRTASASTCALQADHARDDRPRRYRRDRHRPAALQVGRGGRARSRAICGSTRAAIGSARRPPRARCRSSTSARSTCPMAARTTKPRRAAVDAGDPGARAEPGARHRPRAVAANGRPTCRSRGAPDNPAITGRADLIRGDYDFAGRDFQLERGDDPLRGRSARQPRARHRRQCRHDRADRLDPRDRAPR